MSKEKITRSSGNVFADIGLADADELSVKAQLVVNLHRLMKLHRLTQAEVAGLVGTDQPTISKVLRGQLSLVTVERLLQWHSCLGQDVQISIRDQFSRKPEKATKRGNVSVFTCPCPV